LAIVKFTPTDKKDMSATKGNILTGATLLFALTVSLFGGAEPNANFNLLLMFLAGIALIIALMASDLSSTFFRLPIFVRMLIVAPFTLPLIQLIPLPSDVWTLLPGQQLRLEVLQLIGKDKTWQPLSLAPTETAYSAAMGIFFSAFLVALIAISFKHLKYVILVAITVTILGTFIGALQFSGAFSALNFYENAHTNMLVGFFANKNHMALILVVTLIMSKMFFDNMKSKNSSIMYLLFAIFIVIAIVATNSRAGIALLSVALLMVFAPRFKGLSRNIFVIGAMLVASTFYYISSSPTFDIVYRRFSDVGEDVRWDFLVNSTALIREFFLFGSGYGSFSSVYMTRERVEALSPVYTNHLHSDYLQLLIEGGLLGLLALVLLGFVIFKAWCIAAKNDGFRQLIWIGLSTVVLFGLHSIVDYPMRRPAALVYFSIGLACMFRVFLPIAELPSRRVHLAQTA
jgi:O-antigen ligase